MRQSWVLRTICKLLILAFVCGGFTVPAFASSPAALLEEEPGAIFESEALQLCFAEDGLRIPMLFQHDYDTVLFQYNGKDKSVASSGCGAVCLSMAAIFLTDDVTLTPDTIFIQAYKEGYYRGNGLSIESICKLAAGYGIICEWADRHYGRIRNALTAGYPVIACMGKGWFTGGGHYIVLRGLTGSGELLVNDPGSKNNSMRSFEISFIMRQAKGASPFLILYPEK